MPCPNHMEREESLIWREIKKSASAINKVGGNTISLLLWSKGKTLLEVQRMIDLIITTQGKCQKDNVKLPDKQ